MKKVVLIGTGNVGTALGRLIKQSAAYEIVEVVGRNTSKTAALAQLLSTHAGTLHNITTSADLYIIAVADDAIEVVAKQLPMLPEGIVVHTAGSVSIQVLDNVKARGYGVFYPLQSLRSDRAEMPEIPLMIQGNNTAIAKELFDTGSQLSTTVLYTDDDSRMKLHIGAVMVSNFTNYLYTAANEYCREQEVEFNALIPLIMETANRLKQCKPQQMQTGPAARGDIGTIKKHTDLLAYNPQLQKLYSVLSEAIMQQSI